MKLFLIELKKITNSTALWGFVVLCLILNLISILTNPGNEYTRYIAETSKETGFVLGEIYNSHLEQIPTNEEQSLYKSMLKRDTTTVVEVFDGYDSDKIANAYISFYGLTGNVADAMNAKYANLQKAIDKKAETNESMTLYFASGPCK